MDIRQVLIGRMERVTVHHHLVQGIGSDQPDVQIVLDLADGPQAGGAIDGMAFVPDQTHHTTRGIGRSDFQDVLRPVRAVKSSSYRAAS